MPVEEVPSIGGRAGVWDLSLLAHSTSCLTPGPLTYPTPSMLLFQQNQTPAGQAVCHAR